MHKNKKIKISLINKELLKFQIEENAVKGDYFLLSEFEKINFSNFRKLIETKEEQIINNIEKRWKQEKLPKLYLAWKNDFVANNKEYQKLKNDNLLFKEKIENLKKTLLFEFEKDKINIKNNYDAEILKLETINKNLKESFKLKQINEINNMKLNLLNNEKKIQQKYEQLINEKNLLIKDLESEKKFRNQTLLNPKLRGEDLEKWIYEQLNEISDLDDNISWKKTTKSVKHSTFPDFIVNISKNNNLISNIIIEAKSQGPTGDRNNLSFIPSLDKLRKKYNAEFAILVTELEKNHKFLAYRPKNKNNNIPYENIYIIRPMVLKSFILIIKDIVIKRTAIMKNVIKFKNKETILNEFKKFKNNLIDVHIDHVNKTIEKIRIKTDQIEIYAKQIHECINVLLNTHVRIIKKQILNFDINKKIINKINHSNYE